LKEGKTIEDFIKEILDLNDEAGAITVDGAF